MCAFRLTILCLAVLASSDRTRGAELVFSYVFNGTGTTVPALGGSHPYTLGLFDAASQPADLHGPPGSGVSGLAGDRAFDNTASTGMGSANTGGYAQPLQIPSLPAMDSITLTAWYKTDGTEKWTNFARIFLSEGLNLYAFPESVMRLGVNDSSGFNAFTADADFTETQQWVFVAVTYDSTSISENVKLYKGSSSTPVTLLDSPSFDNNPVMSNFNYMVIGNTNANNNYGQPLDGYIDNVRLYSGTGATGTLDIAQLELVRQQDIAGPVEPPTLTVERIPGDQLKFTWESNASLFYQLSKSTMLTTWADEGIEQAGTGNPMELVVPLPADPGTYYRLEASRAGP